MSTARRLQAMYESKQQEWEVVCDRLNSLRQAKAIETDPENKFKLEQRIKVVGQEQQTLLNELTQLEQQLSQLKNEEGKTTPSATSPPSVKEPYRREVVNSFSQQPSSFYSENQLWSNLETPPSVEYANLGQRLIAFIIDVVICFVLFYVSLQFFNGLRTAIVPGDSYGSLVHKIADIGSVVVAVLYHPVLEAWLGQTFGKGIVGITLTDLRGNKVGLGTSLSRFILKVISILFFGLGLITTGIALLNSPKKQGLHDSWTDCIVLTRRSLGG
jgi:uncharacterized RDD family membrane protein YckC